MTTLLVVLAALAVDATLGEPRRLHPLVGFGYLAHALERRLYAADKCRGALAVLLLVAPFGLLSTETRLTPAGPVLYTILLYLAIGRHSLRWHARSVQEALAAHRLEQSRERVGLIVSRDTNAMQDSDVAKAAVESVLVPVAGCWCLVG